MGTFEINKKIKGLSDTGIFNVCLRVPHIFDKFWGNLLMALSLKLLGWAFCLVVAMTSSLWNFLPPRKAFI